MLITVVYRMKGSTVDESDIHLLGLLKKVIRPCLTLANLIGV